MKKIENLDEIKKIELGILISFDKFCRNNDIRYSLGGGTMIGAVRHRGFIPWDDHIDIFMMRKEYDKFLNLLEQNKFILDKEFYYVLSPKDEKNIYSTRILPVKITKRKGEDKVIFVLFLLIVSFFYS